MRSIFAATLLVIVPLSLSAQTKKSDDELISIYENFVEAFEVIEATNVSEKSMADMDKLMHEIHKVEKDLKKEGKGMAHNLRILGYKHPSNPHHEKMRSLRMRFLDAYASLLENGEKEDARLQKYWSWWYLHQGC